MQYEAKFRKGTLSGSHDMVPAFVKHLSSVVPGFEGHYDLFSDSMTDTITLTGPHIGPEAMENVRKYPGLESFGMGLTV